jgi:hypothetical protein
MILAMYSNFSPSASHITALNELGGGRDVRVVGNEAEAMALAAHAEILLGHRYLRQVLPFAPSGLLNAGFAAEAAQRDNAEAGAYQNIELSPASPMIVFWLSMFGLQKDDVLEM